MSGAAASRLAGSGMTVIYNRSSDGRWPYARLYGCRIRRRRGAPRFTAKTLDGEKFSNESLKGKVVLVQFWATWCQYCRRDQPSVDAIVEDFADKGLVVLAVTVGEPKRKVKQYLAESPRACQVVLMEDTNLAALYAARSIRCMC